MLRKLRKIPHITYRYFFVLLRLIIICTLLFSCSNKEILTQKQRLWLQQQDSIKVAINPYYSPYLLYKEDGTIEGVFIEYLELIEKKIGHTFEKVRYDTWSDLMTAVRNEEVDIILEMHPTTIRKSYLNFYGQLFETPHILVTRNDRNKISKIEDFYDTPLILPYDYSIIDDLKQKYPDVQLISDVDDFSCLLKVSKGEYKGYIGPKAIVHYIIENKKLENLKVVKETEFSYSPGIAVFKKNLILNEVIEEATKNISREETEAIVNNWLFNVVTPYYQTSKFWMISSASIIVLLFLILLVNSYLNGKVREQTKELRIAKENAEESDRLKTNFIRNISHEIRTPMNGIIGFSEFLNNPELTNQEQHEYTQIITNSGKQLMSIIEDILEISKLRSKQVKVFPEKTDLTILFDNIYSVFKTKANNKGIKLVLENKLRHNQSHIFIDKSKLSKIIRNLVDNAIKFTEKGEVKIIYETKDNSLLLITIQDTGSGIHQKDQKAIFKSFSQSGREIKKDKGGLGLGLTIANENTILMEGQLTFVSKVNIGTTFTLSLPYTFVRETNTEETQNKSNTSSIPEKHIVLIAEDGEVNFLFLKMILNKLPHYNFVIYRAKNGKEAVDVCNENHFIDLVLMDIKMPVMDGYEATQKIKKARPNLPIIAQTAYSTEEDIQKALSAGCDDFVSKPIDPKILKSKLVKHFSIPRKS